MKLPTDQRRLSLSWIENTSYTCRKILNCKTTKYSSAILKNYGRIIFNVVYFSYVTNSLYQYFNCYVMLMTYYKHWIKNISLWNEKLEGYWPYYDIATRHFQSRLLSNGNVADVLGGPYITSLTETLLTWNMGDTLVNILVFTIKLWLVEMGENLDFIFWRSFQARGVIWILIYRWYAMKTSLFNVRYITLISRYL